MGKKTKKQEVVESLDLLVEEAEIEVNKELKKSNDELKFENESMKKQNEELIKELQNQKMQLAKSTDLIESVVKKGKAQKYTFEEQHPRDNSFSTQKLYFRYEDGGIQCREINNDIYTIKAWEEKYPDGEFSEFKEKKRRYSK